MRSVECLADLSGRGCVTLLERGVGVAADGVAVAVSTPAALAL